MLQFSLYFSTTTQQSTMKKLQKEKYKEKFSAHMNETVEFAYPIIHCIAESHESSWQNYFTIGSMSDDVPSYNKRVMQIIFHSLLM